MLQTETFITFLVFLSFLFSTDMTMGNRMNVPMSSKESRRQKPVKEAYVTLLNERSLELKVRVLGQSLKDTHSSVERVVMCTPEISTATMKLLKSEGWTVRLIEGFESRAGKNKGGYFDKSYDILQLWKMKDYRRVVWINPSALVIRNIDHLFKCGNFCAVFQRSNYFRTTIMVVKPSINEFAKILSWAETYFPKLTPVDIVLNSYYNTCYRLMYNVMFDGSLQSYYHEEPLRLSAGYQAIGFMHIVNSHWYLKEESIYVIDYTDYGVGFLHPAYWWSHPLIEINRRWYEERESLPSHFHEPSIRNVSNWLPMVVLGILYILIRYLPCSYQIANHSRTKAIVGVISLEQNGWMVAMVPIVITFLSYTVAFNLVPSTMWPLQAWILYILWTATLLSLFYSFPCYILYCTSGRINLMGKSFQTLMVLIGFFLIHFTSLAFLYSILNFHKRLLATCLCTFMCLAYSHFIGKYVLRTWHRQVGVNNNNKPGNINNVNKELIL